MNDGSAKQAWIRAAVREYEQPLMRYAYRRTGNVALAQEIVQDTFLKLWQTPQETVDGHLRPWLYTVCRNRAIDVCRKESRMKTTLDNQPTLEAEGELQGNDEREQKNVLQEAMKQLNEKQQEVLRLKFQSGLSYKEIADVMDMTVNHVGVLLHNAMKAVRTHMTQSDSGAYVFPNERGAS